MPPWSHGLRPANSITSSAKLEGLAGDPGGRRSNDPSLPEDRGSERLLRLFKVTQPVASQDSTETPDLNHNQPITCVCGCAWSDWGTTETKKWSSASCSMVGLPCAPWNRMAVQEVEPGGLQEAILEEVRPVKATADMPADSGGQLSHPHSRALWLRGWGRGPL